MLSYISNRNLFFVRNGCLPRRFERKQIFVPQVWIGVRLSVESRKFIIQRKVFYSKFTMRTYSGYFSNEESAQEGILIYATETDTFLVMGKSFFFFCCLAGEATKTNYSRPLERYMD